MRTCWWSTVRTGRSSTSTSSSSSGCLPSLDPMFQSVGAVYGAAAAAVVLTGMGRTECRAARMVSAGASVLAQDEASCAVWAAAGRPRSRSCLRGHASRTSWRVGSPRGWEATFANRAAPSDSRGASGSPHRPATDHEPPLEIETALSVLLRERGISTLDELITILVMNKEPGLSNRVVEALLNNETYFFRDRTPFDTLAKNAIPRSP